MALSASMLTLVALLPTGCPGGNCSRQAPLFRPMLSSPCANGRCGAPLQTPDPMSFAPALQSSGENYSKLYSAIAAAPGLTEGFQRANDRWYFTRVYCHDGEQWQVHEDGAWKAVKGTGAKLGMIAAKAAGVKLVEFSAQWCGPCQRMKPILKDLEGEGYAIERHDVDRESDLARKYHIRSMPTFIVERDGRELRRRSGSMSKSELKRFIDGGSFEAEPVSATAEKPCTLCSGKCDPCDCEHCCRDCKPTAATIPGETLIGDVPNFGLDLAHMGGKGGYSTSGHPEAEAFAARAQGKVAFGDHDIPDDSQKPFLTVIGSEAECAPVLADLQAGKCGDVSGYRLHDYRPDHWTVKGLGFPPGSPSVLIQDAGGKVLHRQADYAGGPELLARALRKASPDYRPDLDPDLAHPKKPAPAPDGPKPAPAGIDVNLVLIVAAVFAVIAVATRKNEEPQE